MVELRPSFEPDSLAPLTFLDGEPLDALLPLVLPAIREDDDVVGRSEEDEEVV